MNYSNQKNDLPKLSILAAVGSILFLVFLHVLSPEFAPSWRMVSEYANGNYKWALSLFFILWGVSSCLLAVHLWKLVSNKKSRIGVVLLFISGIGEISAAIFDVNHSLHGFAGLLGVPTLPVAALLISYGLTKREEWAPVKKEIIYSAHFTWITLAIMVVSMIVMMNGFLNAGIDFSKNATPPETVPAGVIALAG
ncbi:MAG TPA: DUF998 domain-containing protein, partial [Chitinophagaceae bacterium]|nr:DUF998 domain-containing protein [Chitinophagaceae bacterium]